MMWLVRGLLLGLALAIAAVPLDAAFHAADAQERVQRKSILQLLFGGGKREVREPKVKKQIRRKPRKKVSTAARKAAQPAAVVVEKAPDARRILVVGDFMAGGIGDGLTEAFSTLPGIVVESRTNGSSGIVRTDYYDWPAELPAMIAEVKPALVVLSLGANDRQQMRFDAGTRADFRTEAWTREYVSRVERLAAMVASGSNTPLLWVGLPPFQSSSMTADMITFNTLYRAGVEKAGGTFVDIWEGFVDENGRFVVTGSDINGQQVRLRGSDGINFTKAGKRKLAFYVEKEIRRLLGGAALAAGPLGTAEQLEGAAVAVSLRPEDIKTTLPISLVDPELDGGTLLLGGSLPEKGSGRTPREQLVEKGETATAPQGRVDFYRLPEPATR
ncbi:DUF459 domain-containing protein [Rhizobium sp. TRM95111]|uniref:SGNH/GDSL hydrolase family protein n=1 Tax=Rhizobium alarense TaxID=2846851 RepID=UPI001F318EED|nr:DUF459 domain-containing protein [Rhizobium alarense]MCF3638470.1 DUF459 domain-containing protein [Rhizobium alarense]